MSHEFLNGEYPTITMKDDETGENVEFTVIDSIEVDGTNYFLVIESENIEDEDAEALLLKEVLDKDNEIIYSIVEEDVEFESVIHLLNESSDEYNLQV